MTPNPEDIASALGKARHHLEAALNTVKNVKWKDLADRERQLLRGARMDAEKAVVALKNAVG